MERKRRRKVRQVYTRVSFSILFFLFLCLIVKNSGAKYTSSATSNVSFDLAYYLFKDESISQDLRLSDILPRSQPYVYTISVANYDGTDRTQTAIEYDIEIKTTTNLPLEFAIHKQGESTSVIDSQQTVQDDYGTYFREIQLEGDVFGFSTDQSNVYVLEITFPQNYNLAQYEGIIEYIQVTVDSKQKLR